MFGNLADLLGGSNLSSKLTHNVIIVSEGLVGFNLVKFSLEKKFRAFKAQVKIVEGTNKAMKEEASRAKSKLLATQEKIEALEGLVVVKRAIEVLNWVELSPCSWHFVEHSIGGPSLRWDIFVWLVLYDIVIGGLGQSSDILRSVIVQPSFFED
ncbi:hypothetical protein COCNU_scaffold012639G000010 [Cocos nucifera]|nr:hypothetical protein [Cocos nucifera]